jgi:hypothetical protein
LKQKGIEGGKDFDPGAHRALSMAKFSRAGNFSWQIL